MRPPARERLAELSAHGARGGEYADDIDYVAFGYRNERLARFDLIDTPGLNSLLGADSDNTMRHLRPRVDTAEALILVFNRGIHERDEELLAHFQRTNAAQDTDVSPLTTIGAYTHVERLWKARTTRCGGPWTGATTPGTATTTSSRGTPARSSRARTASCTGCSRGRADRDGP